MIIHTQLGIPTTLGRAAHLQHRDGRVGIDSRAPSRADAQQVHPPAAPSTDGEEQEGEEGEEGGSCLCQAQTPHHTPRMGCENWALVMSWLCRAAPAGFGSGFYDISLVAVKRNFQTKL